MSQAASAAGCFDSEDDEPTPLLACASTFAIATGSPIAAGARLEELALARARRQYDLEEPNEPTWALHKKHIFILSSAGKPIFSRYGDESKLAPTFGVLQALISFVRDQGDTLRYIKAGAHHVVFLMRGPLYLVAVSSIGEPVQHTWRQLRLLHAQIFSILTGSRVESIFARNAAYDARGLLGGTDRVMRSLLHSACAEPSMMLQAAPCLRMPASTRAELNKLLISRCRSTDVLFGCLLAHNHLVTLMRPKRTPLHPDDMWLIMNTVSSSFSFREDEVRARLPVAWAELRSWPSPTPYINTLSFPLLPDCRRGYRFAYHGSMQMDTCMRTSRLSCQSSVLSCWLLDQMQTRSALSQNAELRYADEIACMLFTCDPKGKGGLIFCIWCTSQNVGCRSSRSAGRIPHIHPKLLGTATVCHRSVGSA